MTTSNLAQFYRLATSEEQQYYRERLYPLQDRVMAVAALYDDNIYLTGGTALSRFYFQHRYSDDLDFFTTTDDLKLIATDLAARLKSSGLTIEIERLDIFFARFYVVEPWGMMKIEFSREFHLIDTLDKMAGGIYANSLQDIGANKITAFEDRAEIKDILDLFYIVRSISLEELFELADRKRVPVAYENLLAIHSVGISGKSLLIEPVSEEQLGLFLHALVAATEKEVKKKEALIRYDIHKIVTRLLWDFPLDERKITSNSVPVLQRRLQRLHLPARHVLESMLPALPKQPSGEI
ncbi:MAG: nucleotidyl transferase AbiEii/AbiGii toxin family protein [Chloroflexi bacterium]|nr:nucleotidyl transferase AbiEii/AbiGii toxin family protein [Chloroflexota bacterium]